MRVSGKLKTTKSLDRGHQLIALLAAFSAIGLAIGCGGAKALDIEVDPTFDYSQAASGEIGIAGFAVMVEDEDRRAVLQRQLPPLLAQSLNKKRPDLTVLAPGRIQQALGEENHRVTMDRYGAEGSLDPGSMAQLFDATRGMVRYVILGRVARDDIIKTEAQEGDSSSSGKRYKTSREMDVFMEIYDLETGHSVFSGLISNAMTNDRYVPDISVETGSWGEAGGSAFFSCLESCLWDIFQSEPEDDGYPSPPAISELAGEIFDEFAEQLPSPDDT